MKTLNALMRTLQLIGWDCYLHSIAGTDGRLKSVLIVNERRG